MKKETWKKWLTVALTIVGIVIGKVVVAQFFTGNTTENNTKALLAAASEMNQNLPMNIDSETILISTTGAINEFTYHNKLPNYSLDDLDVDKFSAAMQPQIRNSVCTLEGMQTFRDMKIVVKYSYVDSTDRQIVVIGVDTKSCEVTPLNKT